MVPVDNSYVKGSIQWDLILCCLILKFFVGDVLCCDICSATAPPLPMVVVLPFSEMCVFSYFHIWDLLGER